MLPLTTGDALAAARALFPHAPSRRPWVFARLCAEAHRAAAARDRSGRMHPRWGDGSLMAAALRRDPPGEPPLNDPDFRACLILVLARAPVSPGCS